MKRKIYVRIVCVVLAVALIASVALVAISSFSASAVSAGQSGYINASDVNLRSGAGTSYSVVTCMSKNTKFTFVDGKLYNSNWYQIKLTSNSKTGYVYKDYVTAESTSSSSSSDTGYINASDVNLRSGAGTSYSVVTCMSKNTQFTFVSTSLYNTNWYNIKLSNGTTGYVYKDYITQNTNTTTTTTTTTTSSVTGYVNASSVNLRSGAGTSYSIVTCMDKNTQFTFISTSLYNSNWYNIKLSNGKTGYIYSTYATKNSSTQTPTTPATTTPNSSSGLKISSSSQTLYVNNQYVLYATGASSVTWSSSDTSVATVNSSGVVTAKKSGTATIKATSGSKSVSCAITVKSGSSVNISNSSIADMSRCKSLLLKSSTSGVSWKSSNNSIATVDNGLVYASSTGYVTITAYTSSGAASCLINVTARDSIKFTYASPNSAALNSTVNFKAITDSDRVAVRFVVSNGSTSYTVDATSKTSDGDNYIWTASKQLTKSGKWTVKAYSKYKNSSNYSTTPDAGEAEAFVTTSTDTTTTVCSERRASDDVINLIADYEGFLSELTPDNITSDPTLGYGKVILSGEQFYNNLTKAQAYAYLVKTVNSGGYTSKTNSFLLDNNIKFNQRQFDSLVCFTYNVGASAIYNDSDLQSVLLNTGSGSSVSAGASGYVNASDVNLRSGAGTSYSVLSCMSQNTKFTFVDGKVYNSNWYKIKLSDGTVGYIYKSYASTSGGSRDLNNVSKSSYLDNFLQYHHAAGSCYWGLLYRRVDEAEVFFYGDYTRDGQNNKKNFSFSCYKNSSFSIG
jgi:uncharacterized protein YgiM (DUF1202 family)